MSELIEEAKAWQIKQKLMYSSTATGFAQYIIITKLITALESSEQAVVDRETKVADLQDLAIWMTGCGYDFTQHSYFNGERNRLLTSISGKDSDKQPPEAK